MLLSQALFYDAIPFKFIESPYFRKFMDFVAPGFQLTTRGRVADHFLDISYQRIQTEVTQALKREKKITLGCDGSSDSGQEPLTHLIAIPQKNPPLLLREFVHLEEQHTAPNILKIIDAEVMQLTSMGIGVRGLITDNEAKMVNVRDQFRVDYSAPGLIVSCPGDPPHALQLIVVVRYLTSVPFNT